jgi:hypothetical protein
VCLCLPLCLFSLLLICLLPSPSLYLIHWVHSDRSATRLLTRSEF